MFLPGVDEFLCGDVAISMLTLFRVAICEDCTDVLYDTMAVYPLRWIDYLAFTFLTVVVFLNMMVATILEVVSEEQNAAQANQARDERDPLSRRLDEMQATLHELLARIPHDKCRR